MRDEYFDELVFSDVSDWLDHHDEQVSILLFPPVLNKYRFRIHQVIQQSFPNLTTVSIGQEESRRTVVYPATVLDFKRPLFTPHTPLTPAMESSERPHSSGKKARPSLQAYVPPGLRNQEHRVHGVKASLSTAKRKGNALTSTKRKSIAIVPESRSEPVEVSISPYQVRFSFHFRRREAKRTSNVRLCHSHCGTVRQNAVNSSKPDSRTT